MTFLAVSITSQKSSLVHVSFITTIKICKDYEWLVDSIILYVRNIHAYAVKYNILVLLIRIRLQLSCLASSHYVHNSNFYNWYGTCLSFHTNDTSLAESSSRPICAYRESYGLNQIFPVSGAVA